jgi:hypothetical protein
MFAGAPLPTGQAAENKRCPCPGCFHWHGNSTSSFEVADLLIQADHEVMRSNDSRRADIRLWEKSHTTAPAWHDLAMVPPTRRSQTPSHQKQRAASSDQLFPPGPNRTSVGSDRARLRPRRERRRHKLSVGGRSSRQRSRCPVTCSPKFCEARSRQTFRLAGKAETVQCCGPRYRFTARQRRAPCRRA